MSTAISPCAVSSGGSWPPDSASLAQLRSIRDRGESWAVSRVPLPSGRSTDWKTSFVPMMMSDSWRANSTSTEVDADSGIASDRALRGFRHHGGPEVNLD